MYVIQEVDVYELLLRLVLIKVSLTDMYLCNPKLEERQINWMSSWILYSTVGYSYVMCRIKFGNMKSSLWLKLKTNSNECMYFKAGSVGNLCPMGQIWPMICNIHYSTVL